MRERCSSPRPLRCLGNDRRSLRLVSLGLVACSSQYCYLNSETGEFVPVDNTGVLDPEAAAAARATVEALGDILQTGSEARAAAAADGEAAPEESLEEKKLRLLASLGMMDVEPATAAPDADPRAADTEHLPQSADADAGASSAEVETAAAVPAAAAPAAAVVDPHGDALDPPADSAASTELAAVAAAPRELPSPGLALQIDNLTVRLCANSARTARTAEAQTGLRCIACRRWRS